MNIQIEAIKKLPENGELPLMSYHAFVNKIREIIVMRARSDMATLG